MRRRFNINRKRRRHGPPENVENALAVKPSVLDEEGQQASQKQNGEQASQKPNEEQYRLENLG